MEQIPIDLKMIKTAAPEIPFIVRDNSNKMDGEDTLKIVKMAKPVGRPKGS